MGIHSHLRRARLLALLPLICLALRTVEAGSATWNLNPATSDWNTASNWTPNTVPDGPDDVATFDVSIQTAVTIATFALELNELIFNPGASAFTIKVTQSQALTISGTGITNNSGIDQNFVLTSDFSELDLTNNATVGEKTVFTLTGGNGFDALGGFIGLVDTASAGNGTFVIYGAESQNGGGGEVGFSGNSSAGNGTFTVKAASRASLFAGEVTFFDNSTAANGTFVIEGAAVGSAGGGHVIFSLGRPTAGNGVFIINGGSTVQAVGGLLTFVEGSGGNATLIANSGTNGGGGGTIVFLSDGDGGEARIELFGNGTLSLFRDEGMATVGSIEGDGLVDLAGDKLVTGSNNLSTTFSGTIQSSGSMERTASLEKIGTGALTLTGANTYRGGTTITSGILLVSNSIGSGTGTGAVSVNAGTLGGGGIISGSVTFGTNSGTGASLAPSKGVKKPATLTIQGALRLSDDSTYIYKLDTKRVKADEVIANGVVIGSGAKFSLRPSGNNALTTGQVFSIISNSSANPIVGTFHNLRDGAIVTVNGNNLQASYTGGDGNDLTLTVVP